jgi:LPS export ABC transporter protein LptC
MNLFRMKTGLHLLNSKCVIVALLSVFVLNGCKEATDNERVLYDGPLEVVNDVVLQISEGGIVKVTMETPLQLRYRNENKIYPDSIFINFYTPDGSRVMTTLRADSGRYDNSQKLYTVMGNVHIVNKEKQEHTYTQLLNWNPQTKKVYSDKHVLNRSLLTGSVMEGTGMDADQAFKQIILRNARGRDYMNVD